MENTSHTESVTLAHHEAPVDVERVQLDPPQAACTTATESRV